MNVLLVNFTDAGGGAAIAAYRLARALNERGVKATLGVVEKQSAAPFVVEIPLLYGAQFKRYKKRAKELMRKFFEKYCPLAVRLFAFRTTNNILHSTNFTSLIDVNWINNFDCDVVNLHWIAGDMLSIKDIAKITKPIVWTMHDSWPCCGAEHYQNILENDTRWRDGYYSHNKPATTKGPDICRKVWKQKKKYLIGKNIVFVAPSNWEHDVLKSSSLFHHCTCHVIPNVIDHAVFFPCDKKLIRDLLEIPKGKRVLGFGAAENLDDLRNRKGSYYLLDALQKLHDAERYFLVVFGPASGTFTERIQLPYFASGYVASPELLSLLYNACDVFICPSLIENLPTTCLEAVCCGVPVVAFNVGGTADIIEHKKNGYLAEPYDTDDLANGIEYCITHKGALSKQCIEKAHRDFDTDSTVKKMIQVLYDAD
ncbi:MAG: glycosyltransferase [Treponema sp.]|nr:glycosyltransferase [Treponema sp.]